MTPPVSADTDSAHGTAACPHNPLPGSFAIDLFRALIRPSLYIPYAFRRLTRTGPFAGGAEPEVLPADAPPLKQALWKHYVRQYHEASCSVASVATVVNALREVLCGEPSEITQPELLDRVAMGNWKKRMSPGGDNGKRGLPLALFGEVVTASLAAFEIPVAGVETVAMGSDRKAIEPLKHRLHGFEAGDSLIIAHFDQGAFLPELNIPHISPVGGYDDETSRITILDVDQFQPTPYSVSFERFLRGISRPYLFPFRLRGLKTGGYVHIRLR